MCLPGLANRPICKVSQIHGSPHPSNEVWFYPETKVFEASGHMSDGYSNRSEIIQLRRLTVVSIPTVKEERRMTPMQIRKNGTEISALIAPLLPAIYESATNPALWPEAFAPIVRLLGGNKGLLFSHQATPEQKGIWATYRISEEDFRPYVERYHALDVWMQRGHELGLFVPGNVMTGDDLLPREEFLASIFYREHLALHDIHDLCCGILHDGSEPDIPIVHIAIYCSHAKPLFGAAEKVLVAALIPHLREATRIGFRTASLEHRVGIMQSAVETLSPALVLLDSRGSVVFTSGRARELLATSDRLSLVAGKLVVERMQQARLDAWLAISPTDETMLGILGPSGKPNIWLIRVPMPTEETIPPDSRRPAIALMIHDSTAVNKIDIRGFAKFHGLTPAEARLLNLLPEHTSLPPISQALGVSIHTIRSQLRTIREKTGARRQAELVKMMMSWPRP
ncbi:MAG: helix-turn-helix transcriptional regulator [Proteobacteria bacterium]|nr:helix-turn-helix transcriptional regulator [Pseudomonadota bacterium]